MTNRPASNCYNTDMNIALDARLAYYRINFFYKGGWCGSAAAHIQEIRLYVIQRTWPAISHH